MGRTLEVFVERFNKSKHIVCPLGQRTHLSVEFRQWKQIGPGFVRVLENLESHGNLKFQNPGLENLENMCWSLKVLEN